jgi:hypothetical protein
LETERAVVETGVKIPVFVADAPRGVVEPPRIRSGGRARSTGHIDDAKSLCPQDFQLFLRQMTRDSSTALSASAHRHVYFMI